MSIPQLPPEVRLLRIFRRAAGFSSANAAALRFGWPQASYRAHESATRRPTTEEYRRYLLAFGAGEPDATTETSWLLSISDERVAAEALVRSRAKEGVKPVVGNPASRLKSARLVAGFATARDFAAEYGWAEQTIYWVERNPGALTEKLAERYALALNVSADWLLSGLGTSGLPNAVEQHLGRQLTPGSHLTKDLGRQLLDRAVKTRACSPAKMREWEAENDPGDAVAMPELDIIAEIGIKDLVKRAFGDASPVSDRIFRSWGFPAGYSKSVFGCEAKDLRIVSQAEQTSDEVQAGDRLVVGLKHSDRTKTCRRLFINRSGKIRIVAASDQTAGSGFVEIGRVLMGMLHGL